MKFVWSGRTNSGNGRRPGNAHALDSFLHRYPDNRPRRINFSSNICGGEKSSDTGSSVQRIAAQDTVAHDRRRQSLAGDARHIVGRRSDRRETAAAKS